MRNCTGDLAHVINSDFAVFSADIAQVSPNFNFLYSAASQLFLSNFALRRMSFSDSGGLMTIMDNSHVRLLNAAFQNVESSEQGLMRIHNSRVEAEDMKVTNFNATFVDATGGNLTFVRLTVSSGLTTNNGKKLALLPNGGFLTCENCPKVLISDANVSEVSAKEGGVLYLFGHERGSLTIERSIFTSCYAVTAGGVMSTTEYSISVVESQFKHNSAQSGGVISTRARSQVPIITRCTFQYNLAGTDGSCIQWIGTQPLVIDSIFESNAALYGNPMASTPRSWHLIDPNTHLPVNQSLLGVTGQELQDIFVLGEFDAMGQLISTDNSSLVYLQTEHFLTVSGNTELIANEGLTNFSLMFTPFFVGEVNITVTGGSSDVSPYTFQLSLRDCEPGEIRTAGGCYPCPKNSYSLSPSDTACSLCNENADCWGQTDMRLFSDYWRASVLTDSVYECMSRGACLGGLNSECATGYKGTLCGVCERGYFRWVDWDCQSCQEVLPTPARMVLIVLAVFIPATLPSQLIIRSEDLLYNIAWSWRKFLVFAQSMAFITLMHAKWSFPTLIYFEVLQTVGSFGNNLLHMECEFEDMSLSPFAVRLLGVALYPLLSLCASVTAWVVTRLFRQITRSFRQVSGKTILVSFSISVYHFVPILLLAVGESLQCIDVDGKQYLVRDLSLECYASEHLRFVLSISIPLAIISLFLLGVCMKLLMSQSEKVQFLAPSRYLRAGYNTKQHRWELFDIGRWYVLALACVFFPQTEIKCQTVVFAAIFVLSILLLGTHMPHRQPWMNNVNLTSHAFTISFLLTRLCTNDSPVAVAGFTSLSGLLALCAALSAKHRKRTVYPLGASESFSSEAIFAPHPSVRTSVLDVSAEAIFPPTSTNDRRGDLISRRF